ncbi:MAG: hypothetical protein QM790_17040 [Nibricoccus sp.]
MEVGLMSSLRCMRPSRLLLNLAIPFSLLFGAHLLNAQSAPREAATAVSNEPAKTPLPPASTIVDDPKAAPSKPIDGRTTGAVQEQGFQVARERTQSSVGNSDQDDIRRLTERLLMLENDMAKNPKGEQSGIKTAIIAAAAGLLAAVLGGLFTLTASHFAAKREAATAIRTAERQLELAKHETNLRNIERLMDYRLKQLELFYAPMFARLEQSKELYKKLTRQLVQDDPSRYRLYDKPNEEGTFCFVVDAGGKEHGFRILDQLPAIRPFPKSFALVGAIVDLGSEISGIVAKHSGLASVELLKVLGAYAAHYAILVTIYKDPSGTPYPPGWHKLGYYPRNLNAMIENEHKELSRFLDEYADACSDLAKQLKHEAHMKTG